MYEKTNRIKKKLAFGRIYGKKNIENKNTFNISVIKIKVRSTSYLVFIGRYKN